MNRLLKLTLGAFLAFPLLTTACVGYDERVASQSTPENAASDSVITAKIKAKYLADKHVGALDIHVETNNGHVNLAGEAPTNGIRDRAITLAKQVKGVRSVKSAIRIAPEL